MYTALLLVHSWLRWVVVFAGVWAFGRAFSRWRGGAPWTPGDDAAGRVFTISFDLQLVIGLVLYVGFSPIVETAMANMGAAMKEPLLRFYVVEHLTGMVVALVLAHIGRVKSRRPVRDVMRHRAAAIFFGLALLILLLSIPWPAMPYGRPLLRY